MRRLRKTSNIRESTDPGPTDSPWRRYVAKLFSGAWRDTATAGPPNLPENRNEGNGHTAAGSWLKTDRIKHLNRAKLTETITSMGVPSSKNFSTIIATLIYM